MRISVGAADIGPLARAAWRLHARGVHDRAHLDGAVGRRRNARRDLNGVVQILRFDEVVAAELFLGFGEGAIRRGHLAIAHAHCGGALGRLQRFAAEQVSAPLDVLGELPVRLEDLALKNYKS